jgi:hypothetical protein
LTLKLTGHTFSFRYVPFSTKIKTLPPPSNKYLGTKASASRYHPGLPLPRCNGLIKNLHRNKACMPFSCTISGAPVTALRSLLRSVRSSRTIFKDLSPAPFQHPKLSVGLLIFYSSLHCIILFFDYISTSVISQRILFFQTPRQAGYPAPSTKVL